jgi:hypothetical protein
MWAVTFNIILCLLAYFYSAAAYTVKSDSQKGCGTQSTYFTVRGNPISLVFQNIDPPSPSPPGESVLPPQHRRGVHTRRAERGMGGQYFGRREK